MQVKDLIALLKAQDQEAIVIMASDAEGNNHSPFCNMWAGDYVAETTWSGDVGYPELTDELIAEGYGEGDVIYGGEAAVILCPIN